MFTRNKKLGFGICIPMGEGNNIKYFVKPLVWRERDNIYIFPTLRTKAGSRRKGETFLLELAFLSFRFTIFSTLLFDF